jgi:heptose I phosphotransferase
MTAAACPAIWLDEQFRPLLEDAGLDHFAAVMATTEGRCLRVLADRENWRLELPAGGHGFYLKKHHVRTWSTWLRARLGRPVVRSAGRDEVQSAQCLQATGIPVMRCVAWGEKLHGNGRLESFLLTEELDGFRPLDDFLRERFPPHDGGRQSGDLDRLIRQIALVARRLHRAGYNHRDLYCCHFFIREPVAGRFEVRLIDLQRIQYRRRFRHRWLVKDLAQLAWSAPSDRVGCRQRVAFLRHYLGVRKLRPADKRFVRDVLAKQRRMQRRLGTVS